MFSTKSTETNFKGLKYQIFENKVICKICKNNFKNFTFYYHQTLKSRVTPIHVHYHNHIIGYIYALYTSTYMCYICTFRIYLCFIYFYIYVLYMHLEDNINYISWHLSFPLLYHFPSGAYMCVIYIYIYIIYINNKNNYTF